MLSVLFSLHRVGPLVCPARQAAAVACRIGGGGTPLPPVSKPGGSGVPPPPTRTLQGFPARCLVDRCTSVVASAPRPWVRRRGAEAEAERGTAASTHGRGADAQPGAASPRCLAPLRPPRHRPPGKGNISGATVY